MINPQKLRPPHIVLGLYSLAVICQVLFKPERFVPAHYQGLGWLGALGGFGFMLWARQLFVKNSTPVRHSEAPCQLVLEGPYRFTRNPMYVGGLLMFLGIAVIVGTWPFFAVPMVMFAVLHQVFIPWEEKTMEDIFKEDYRKYLKTTRRWL